MKRKQKRENSVLNVLNIIILIRYKGMSYYPKTVTIMSV